MSATATATNPRNWCSDFWIECPDCGPSSKHILSGVGGGKAPLFRCINSFGTVSTYDFRETSTRNGPRSRKMVPGDECNSACLNGKISCDCRCRGRCHGAGQCLGNH